MTREFSCIRIRWPNPPDPPVVLDRGRGACREVREVTEVLMAAEAAAILRVSTATARRLIATKRLSGRRVGARVTTTFADVVRYLEDEHDRAAAREALDEMRRKGLKPIPHEQVWKAVKLG